MKRFECSPQTPWGLHAPVRNDEECPRCGWTAPGPKSDARARSASLATAIAAEHGWTVIAGGGGDRIAA
ncbi:MAG TPA: hypothetical protein VGB08_11715 [Allosphingosinicella sp.]